MKKKLAPPCLRFPPRSPPQLTPNTRALLLLLVLAGAAPGALPAQEHNGFTSMGHREGRLSAPLREGLPEIRGGFTLCRLQYTSDRFEEAGLGWSTDYPTGDENFLIRLSQLTTAHVSQWRDGLPGHAVVQATHPDLYRCPFLFTSDAGTVAFSEAEVARLADYFEKGGFLWVDDFWGDAAWEQWSRQIGRVLPGHAIVELTPDHPLYRVSYRVDALPQISNLAFWQRTGGETSERGAETERATLHGIYDPKGRLVVLMSHNTDIADGWEREWQSNEFFRLFSPRAYGIAVNVAVWVMTR